MTREEYLALRARLRGEARNAVEAPIQFAACQQPICSHPDLIFAGVLPAPVTAPGSFRTAPDRQRTAMRGAAKPDQPTRCQASSGDAVSMIVDANGLEAGQHFPNHHEPRRTTRAFSRAKALTTCFHTLFQKGISA